MGDSGGFGGVGFGGGLRGGQAGGEYGYGRAGGQSRGRVAGPAVQTAPGTVTTAGTIVAHDMDVNGIVVQDSLFVPADMPAEAAGWGGAYVASGVYSLPVSLPGGGLRLDFARPSGDAELTIWAVPDRAVTGTLNTLIVIVISIVAALAIRMWPREFRPAAFKVRYAIIYAVLAVGLTIIFSVAGLIAAAVIVAISELCRSQLALRRAI